MLASFGHHIVVVLPSANDRPFVGWAWHCSADATSERFLLGTVPEKVPLGNFVPNKNVIPDHHVLRTSVVQHEGYFLRTDH